MKRHTYIAYIIVGILGAATIFLLGTRNASDLTAFGDTVMRLEYAKTKQEREAGLSSRPSMQEGEGMVFVFPKDGLHGMWMKNMTFSIDIFWLDSKGHVVSIAANVAPSTYPNVFYPTVPARYVLETIAGFARAHTIATGAPLLLKTFPIVSK